MWQDYFAQHGYLEQTAGWQLAFEGLLGEALTPVAFPEKASWKVMTKDSHSLATSSRKMVSLQLLVRPCHSRWLNFAEAHAESCSLT